MHTYVGSINWTLGYWIRGKRVQILEGDVVVWGSRGSWKEKWGRAEVLSYYICIHVQHSQRIIFKRKPSLKNDILRACRERELRQQSACLIIMRSGIQSPEPLWETLGVEAHACLFRALEAETERFCLGASQATSLDCLVSSKPMITLYLKRERCLHP